MVVVQTVNGQQGGYIYEHIDNTDSVYLYYITRFEISVSDPKRETLIFLNCIRVAATICTRTIAAGSFVSVQFDQSKEI